MTNTDTNNYFLPSEDVQVFPFGTSRSSFDPYGRVLNEQNIRRIVRSVVDNDSYVISYSYQEKEKVLVMEFVIYGYYFKATFSSNVLESNLYAFISIGSSEDIYEYEYLEGGDNLKDKTWKFTGVTFSSSKPESEGNNIKYLQLLDDKGNVPESSWKKFNEFSFDVINCGSATELI